MDSQKPIDNVPFGKERPAHEHDPIHRIRLEIDPTIGPSEMKRPSDLLSYGSGIPEQYLLFREYDRPLEFVVKRHRATNLHTDFRLEAFGKLLSWAFWQQPSRNPKKTIVAREVGDHQKEYLLSERRIPDGSYGAGPMIVWDHGTYRPLVRTNLNDEQTVVSGLQQGRLDFWMEGKTLKGGFRLEIGRKGWLLTKLEDEFAKTQADLLEDRSATTKRTLDDIEWEYQETLRLLRRR